VEHLQSITPITEEAIRPFVGKPVCAVLHDGTYLFGTISDCRDGQLFFQGGVKGPGTVSTRSRRARAQIKQKIKTKAKISFFPFFGFGGGAAAAAISLGLIAALFAFPFGSPFFI
jgi:hypothetical protein